MYRKLNITKLLLDASKCNIKKYDVADVRGHLHLSLPKWKQQLLDSLSWEFSVTISVEKMRPEMKGFYGCAYAANNLICIFDPDIPDKNWFISTLYHEIGHILCYRTHRFEAFHRRNTPKEILKKQVLRAERYVDAIGYELTKMRHPDVEYQFSYDTPEDVALLRKMY